MLGLAGPFVVARAADADAARAEVQINLCSEPQQIARALILRPASGPPTQVWYFDNAGLELADHGLVVRLRLKAGEAELTLKVADQDCTQPPAALIAKADGKCEYDLHGAILKGAVSLSRSLNDVEVQELLTGRRVLAEVLSPAQVSYLQDVVHVWPLPDPLQRLGPVSTEAYRSPNQPATVEVWRLPSKRRFVELSQKTNVENAVRLHTSLTEALTQAGLKVCEDQSSQARAKLEDLLDPR